MTSKTRVLCLTTALGGGGAEMHLLRLMNALDRERFEVSLAVTRTGGSYEPFLAPDVETEVLPGRSLRALLALGVLLRRRRPDIVYSCLDLPNCLAVLATRAWPRRPGLVLSVQLSPLVLYGPKTPWRGRVLGGLIRLLYGRADVLVYPSRGLAHEVSPVLLATRSLPIVIPNAGWDERVVTPAQAATVDGLADDRRLVVACGRLVAQKGFDHLIRAFADVAAAVPADLWILGEGEQRTELEALVGQLGLNGSVHLPGFQPDPFSWMRAADVFVLSSRFEGFGNVIVEAMAAGTAVVATACPHGPEEILEAGVSGLLVEPGDEPALAQAILRVLTDDALRHRLAHAARQRAERFSPASAAAAHGSLFERLRRERSGASHDRTRRWRSVRRARSGELPHAAELGRSEDHVEDEVTDGCP
jgi:glycosyltransferase involved in cell wall biosynthesis